MDGALILGACMLAFGAAAASAGPVANKAAIGGGMAGAATARAPSAPGAQAQPGQAELLPWASIMYSRNKADFQEYLKRYPNGEFAKLARRRIDALSSPGANFMLRDIKVSRGSGKGVPTLLITGEIMNVAQKVQDIPKVRLTLLDARGEALKAWTVPIVMSRLGPKASVPFRFTAQWPPAAATSLKVSFAKSAAKQ
jgi:hypothetical protein